MRLAEQLVNAEALLESLLTQGGCPESVLVQAYNAEATIRERIELSNSNPESWLRRRVARLASVKRHNGVVALPS
jgi:hypothetical protein